jgi:hypothetical protein
MRPAQPAMPTRIAPLLPRFKARTGVGFTGVGAAFPGAATGFTGFLFFTNTLDGVGLAALDLPGLAAATFEAFGAVLRRSDFVAIQPPDTRGGI